MNSRSRYKKWAIKNNTKFEIKNLSVSNVKINVIKNDNQEITSE